LDRRSDPRPEILQLVENILCRFSALKTGAAQRLAANQAVLLGI